MVATKKKSGKKRSIGGGQRKGVATPAFINAYAKYNGHQAKTAEALGITQPAVSQRLKKPECQDLLKEYYASDELKEKLRQVAREGLEASRVISANVIVKSDNPKVKNKNATARDVDFIEVPDHSVRHRYWQDLNKILGHLGPDNGNGNGNQTNFLTIIAGLRQADAEGIAGFIASLRERIGAQGPVQSDRAGSFDNQDQDGGVEAVESEQGSEVPVSED